MFRLSMIFLSAIVVRDASADPCANADTNAKFKFAYPDTDPTDCFFVHPEEAPPSIIKPEADKKNHTFDGTAARKYCEAHKSTLPQLTNDDIFKHFVQKVKASGRSSTGVPLGLRITKIDGDKIDVEWDNKEKQTMDKKSKWYVFTTDDPVGKDNFFTVVYTKNDKLITLPMMEIEEADDKFALFCHYHETNTPTVATTAAAKVSISWLHVAIGSVISMASIIATM